MSNVQITRSGNPIPSTQLSATDQQTIFGDGSGQNPLRTGSLLPNIVGFDPFNVPGAPLYTTSLGTMGLAEADAVTTASVIGLVSIKDDTIAIVGTGALLTLTEAQWNARTASSGGLVTGATYWLSPGTPGDITVNRPTVPGQYATQVGIAQSSTTLLVQIGSAIPI